MLSNKVGNEHTKKALIFLLLVTCLWGFVAYVTYHQKKPNAVVPKIQNYSIDVPISQGRINRVWDKFQSKARQVCANVTDKTPKVANGHVMYIPIDKEVDCSERDPKAASTCKIVLKEVAYTGTVICTPDAVFDLTIGIGD